MSDRSAWSAKRTPTTMECGAVGKGCLVGIGVGALLAILIAMSVGQYNTLVDRQEETRRAWGQIDNQYQRRSELIGNLVKTVEGSANFEKSTLTEIAEARASVGRVQLPASLPTDEAQLQAWVNAQASLGSAVSRLLMVAENYPELQASSAFRGLQDELAGTENRIAAARTDYLEAARSYNAAIRKFPGNLMAGMFGFERAAELPMTTEQRAVPQVEFPDFGDEPK